ncbi:hypothetical protein BHE74_00041124 [Ensete ventricosum]|uniref:Uncharacterized protein n=1 Tax=Ensete ventricosum TaxID=4639 RepID=A0A444BVE9_ENSVE|nr:hypothetical protein GW17_00061527 [Ensete ventricosum]RWW52451.1 hypothetical protein BHE74_00041124 [Ensete ventricosum]RZR74627.1 hypothetical protein BHM03_00039611 [Ensete ventricosum]
MNYKSHVVCSRSNIYASTIDVELKLGWQDEDARRPPCSGHACSLCTKSFTSLQALGGHQTAHRKEMEQMRRQHKAIMTAPPPIVTGTSPDHVVEDKGTTTNLQPLREKQLARDEEDGSVDLELTLCGGGLDLTLRL